VIYADTSVALAWILAEDRRPPASFWDETVVSSRLLEYELVSRLELYGRTRERERAAREVLGRVAFVELVSPALERALRPFPVPVRTLDALHLATLEFLHGHDRKVPLASYHERQLAAARALGLPIHTLP